MQSSGYVFQPTIAMTLTQDRCHSEEDALKIDDDTMKRISEEIAECIMQSFWTGLEYAFEKLEIKHSKKEGE